MPGLRPLRLASLTRPARLALLDERLHALAQVGAGAHALEGRGGERLRRRLVEVEGLARDGQALAHAKHRKLMPACGLPPWLVRTRQNMWSAT
jgi:hypothetical protein